MVQSNGLGSLLSAVDKLGRFEAQYAQIEKVSAHHGDNWEVLLHGHLKADRPVMSDLTDVVELKATSEDTGVLDALLHAKANRTPARDYIPDRDAGGKKADVSFATQNWQKVIRDRRQPGYFVRRRFEAMVFYYLADELRTGDVAVIGSEEYADWSEQLLPWEQVEAKLPEDLAEVGLREAGDMSPFEGRALVAPLRGRLTEAAAKADGEYPDNDELFIDPDTGVSKLKPRRAKGPRRYDAAWRVRAGRGLVGRCCWMAARAGESRSRKNCMHGLKRRGLETGHQPSRQSPPLLGTGQNTRRAMRWMIVSAWVP
ncbi:hypothetical protein [Streptomyces sp. NPDC052701]|uniref:hypothetical protein n=1 Tax=Streptomyces sp. NPDC052701 TaxID=3155533 RepID=UPI003418EC00